MIPPTLPQLPQLQAFQDQWQSHHGSDLFDPKALSLTAALTFMRAYTQDKTTQLSIEEIPLEAAYERVLAQEIVALVNVPKANNSAMDGFAFHSSALLHSDLVSLEVVGKQFAGDSLDDFSSFEPSKHAVQITTGALLPSQCDTVIPQEWVTLTGQILAFATNKIRPYDNCRLSGEDVRAGSVVFCRGRKIRASDMGMLASMGIATIHVFRQLTVAIFSTGNEVQSVGSQLQAGQIFDSNRYTLIGLLQKHKIQLLDLGIIPDDAQALKAAFAQAAQQADVMITSGGVSVGEADFTKQVMRELGDVAFWTLAIKPGRPMAFGKIQQNGKESILFGLPGNPVAVMVTFLQFVKPLLAYLSGEELPKKTTLVAKLIGAIKKRSGRTEFLRAQLSSSSNGDLMVQPYKNQGSGVLSSMSQADCLIILPPDATEIPNGHLVNIEVLT